MISFERALEALLGSVRPLGAERVPLAEADGRVLAEEVRARAPLPPFDYSAMDGYALASSDLGDAPPFCLSVAGESAAGRPAPPLEAGAACRIFTGAEMPAGADCVVPQELVRRQGERIELEARPVPGRFVRRRGEDLAEGAVALARGTRLGPGALALAASLDRPELACARRPVVTVVPSGDELRAPGEPGRPGSIPESNGYFLAAAARRAGALVRVSPFMRDDADATRAAIEDALRGSDVVLTIGGVSVGDRDLVLASLEAAGATLDFWRVAIKPGKPLALARKGDTHVLGLPGNPASAALTFLLFALPLLRALQGDASPLPPRRRLPFGGALAREPGRLEFVRARLETRENREVAVPLPNQASGASTTFARADLLVLVPPDRPRVDPGDELETIRIAEM